MLLLAQGWTASATAEALGRDPHTSVAGPPPSGRAVPKP